MEMNTIDKELNTIDRKKAGRPLLPTAQRRHTVSTTLERETIDRILSKGWKLNDLIVEGMRHREKCDTALRSLVAEVAELKENNERIVKKLVIYKELAENGNSTKGDDLKEGAV